jgi:outer membrane protein assembly factor BamB/orotate phosphoribosyltransferase
VITVRSGQEISLTAGSTIGRENPTDRIRDAIFHRAIRRRDQGVVLVSSKGKSLNWLIDLRSLFMERSFLAAICDAFWEKYKHAEPFQLAGMETAAIPLLAGLLLRAPQGRGDVNGLIIRKDRKTTGVGNAIEGNITGDPIVLVDDILNSGSSAEKARAVIEQAGGRIKELFVVIDYRSRKGLNWRADHAITVQALFRLTDFGLNLHNDLPPPAQKYRPLWRTTVPGGFPFHVVPKSAPLLVGSRIYRGCDAGKMHAFDAETGAIVWEFQATGVATRKGIWSSPAYHENSLYFGAYNGVVYCLDATTGEEKWAQSDGEWVGASPLIVPELNLLYIGLEYQRPWAQGSLAALNLKTGVKVWEGLTKKFQHGSPSYWRGGQLIIWGTADHQMLGIDAKTGKTIWSFQTRRSVKYAPFVDEERGLVAFASFDKSIYVLDAATGEKRGEWITGEICYTTPLIVANRMFCGSGDRHLYVIDLDRMELIKKLDMNARIYSSPRLIGDRVIFGTSGGAVIELDVQTLEVKGRLQMPDAVTNAIAVSDDNRYIYVSTYMNQLYGIERLVLPDRNCNP